MIAHAYVDYTWIGDLDLTLAPLVQRPHAGFTTRGFGQLITVEQDDCRPRTTSRAGASKWASTSRARGASLELFVGAERVIDADQLDRQADALGVCRVSPIGEVVDLGR